MTLTKLRAHSGRHLLIKIEPTELVFPKNQEANQRSLPFLGIFDFFALRHASYPFYTSCERIIQLLHKMRPSYMKAISHAYALQE